jgi:peptidoglycan/xylan/chitin deacetylase (PgdA/CDA1 family)
MRWAVAALLVLSVIGYAAFSSANIKFGHEPAAAGEQPTTTVHPSTTAGDATTEAGATTPCTILGTDGNDVLRGTQGDDVICGLAGDDVMAGGPGNDTLAGGPGRDTVSYRRAGAGVRLRLASEAWGEGHDVLSGFERAVGSAHGDKIVGTARGNRLAGGGGRDVILGGDGHDRIDTRDRSPYDRLNGGGETDICIADPGDWPVHCSHPLVRSHDRRVPILMYHVIAIPGPETPNIDLWVSPWTFAAQMHWLARHRYDVVSLQEVYDYWHGAPLPRKAVVVSFDDGFHGHYTKAMPILARHGWAGTLNLALSHLSRANAFTPRMVRRMLAANWELDSHTRTHAYLPGLGSAALRDEVGGSRRDLRSTFHVQVNFLCYPFGAYSATVITAVRAAGYRGATTTEYGRASRDEPYSLNRIRISHSDGVSGFARKLG